MANEVLNIKKIKEIVASKVAVDDTLTDNYCPNVTEIVNSSIVKYYDFISGIFINNLTSYEVNQLVLSSDVIYKDTPPPTPTPTTKPTIFEFKTTSSNEKVKAPYELKNYDIIIDWGDGTPLKFADDYETHNYVFANTYIVKVYYDTEPKFMMCANNPNLIKITDWGEFRTTGIQQLDNAFSNCINLVSIPPDKTGVFSKIDNWSNCFEGCISLGTITGILDHAINAYEITNIFSNCISLYSISQNMFFNCPSLVNMRGAFKNSGLANIQQDLFSNCPNLVFLDNTFEGCSNMKGTTPLSPRGTLLWEDDRLSGRGCFINCTQLTDYYKIPYEWANN